MREELYNDPYYNEDYSEDWNGGSNDWDENSFDLNDFDNESFDNLPDWIEDVEDPENMDEFNFDDEFEDDLRWDE